MKKNHIFNAIDARQTDEWGRYMQSIGWKVEKVDTIYVFIRKIPYINASIIKIQHPIGPLPFQKIDLLAKKHHALFTLIEPHIAGYNETDFLKNNYKKSTIHNTHSKTIKIDLTVSNEELFKSFSENARRNIKKAQKNNLTIRPVFLKKEIDLKSFDHFYALFKNVGKMKKFFVLPKSEYLKKITAFQKGSVLLFAYEKSYKDPIAVVWFAKYKNVFGYFQTGIVKRGYETFVNYLLVWEGLKIGKKLGCSVFDFESIYDERFPNENKGYKKYTEFKKRFHGEIIEYPKPMIKIYSTWFYVLYKVSSLMVKN